MDIPNYLHWFKLKDLERVKRNILTKELEKIVNNSLVKDSKLSEFQESLYVTMNDLKNAGYIIASWDYSCETEYWGGESFMWSEPYTAEQLKSIDTELHAVSKYPGGVELFWGSDEAPDY